HGQSERVPRDSPRRRRAPPAHVEPDDDRAGDADEGAQAGLSRERNREPRVRAALGRLEGRRVEAVVRVHMVVSAQPVLTGRLDISRRAAIVSVTVATALGAALRFYGLGWGAPYFHFHIDEHVVFTYADALARDTREAAAAAKFFMYSPVPMYLLNAI